MIDNKIHVLNIIAIFSKLYPEAKCSLDFENDLQLLIATQLAAQCTDEQVNKVTKTLFKRYKNVKAFAECDIEELESIIRSTGFYKNKAKNIKNTCRIIIEKFNGKVPNTMEDLLILPGVGRKTANVLLGVIYNIPSIIIDTHAKRISNRIGLSKSNNPDKIELELMDKIPKEYWTQFCHYMVYHGRKVCKARKPMCKICDIIALCNTGKAQSKDQESTI